MFKLNVERCGLCGAFYNSSTMEYLRLTKIGIIILENNKTLELGYCMQCSDNLREQEENDRLRILYERELYGS